MTNKYKNSDIDTTINSILKNNKTKAYTNLVLSGGGMRGIAHVGVIKALSEYKLLDSIKNILGCSAGSLVAFLYCIGYDEKELCEEIKKIDFSKIKSSNTDITQIFYKFGIDDGDEYDKMLKQYLKQKKLDENIDFETLYKTTGMNLIVNGSCLNDKQCYYFSYKTHPRMSVVLAVRISSAFPLFFVPITLDNKMFVDGGCNNNFPIEYFDNEQYQTLGVFIEREVEYLDKVQDIEQYVLSVIECIYTGISDASTKDYKNVIKIKNIDVGVLELDLSDKKIMDVCSRGYKCAINYLKKIFNN